MTPPAPLAVLRKQIRARIKEIKADSRYANDRKRVATVFENAPLALLQMGWESEVKALEWVLAAAAPQEPRGP